MPAADTIELLKQETARPRSRGSILWSMLGLLFLTAFLPLVLTSRYLVNQARADLELDQRSLQIAKVRHLSEWVAQFRNAKRAVLQTLATSLAIEAPDDYRRRIQGLAARRTLEAFPGEESAIVSVSVVERNGFGARSGLALPEPDIAAATQNAFSAGLRGQATSTSPIWSTTIGEPILISGQPVVGPKGNAEAVVIAIISLEPLVRLTRQSGEGGLLDVYVVSGTGLLVAHSNPSAT